MGQLPKDTNVMEQACALRLETTMFYLILNNWSSTNEISSLFGFFLSGRKPDAAAAAAHIVFF